MIGDPRLSPRARAAVGAEEAELLVSAASVWELAMKVRLGKLPEAARLTHRLERLWPSRISSRWPLVWSMDVLVGYCQAITAIRSTAFSPRRHYSRT
jgi:hypothetical protein